MSVFELIKTEDGSLTLQSSIHGELYHSRHGAIQESKHVFIENGFYRRLMSYSFPLSILEIGLGTALNAFLTLLECKEHNIQVNYTALEVHPVPSEIFEKLDYPFQLNVQVYKDLFIEMHTSAWDTPQNIDPFFVFEKRKISFEKMHDKERFDIIYMDAFAPTSQPQFWENPFVGQLYNSLKKDGILTTYCAKGSFKRALKEAGFKVVSVPGPPGKREMTTAYKL